jgi:hypothetical protein
MITIDAILCDAVTVRERLMHLLGGGVTKMMPTAYPAPFAADLALLIAAPVNEVGGQHALVVELALRGGEAFFTATLAFGVNPSDSPDDTISLSIAIPLKRATISGPGVYEVSIFVDGTKFRTLRVEATEATAPAAD